METESTDLIEYLKQVAKLEASVHSQKQAIIECEKTFEANIPEKTKKMCNFEEPVEPVCHEVPFPQKPNEPFSIKGWIDNNDWLLVLSVIAIVGLILGFMLSPSFCIGGMDRAAGIVTLIVFAPAMIEGVAYLGYYVMAKKKYQSEMKTYSERLFKAMKQQEIADSNYQKRMELFNKEKKSYDKKVSVIKEKNDSEYSTILKAYKKSETSTLKKLEECLGKSENILMDLYNKDIIFGKYRNMVAMATIYEYFESGRCSELTGQSGAYNLYETELRQNIIINELSSINTNLQKIQKNQYVLYTELSEGNKQREALMAGVGELVRSTNTIKGLSADIAKSSAITAYCSEVTAMNTMALAVMEAWN